MTKMTVAALLSIVVTGDGPAPRADPADGSIPAGSKLVLPIDVGPDPCGLASTPAITSSLGKPPAGKGTVVGPTVDDETGATVTVCTVAVGKGALMIAVAEFASAASAGKAMTTLATREPEDPAELKMTIQAGVGERALWGHSDTDAAAAPMVEGAFTWASRRPQWRITSLRPDVAPTRVPKENP